MRVLKTLFDRLRLLGRHWQIRYLCWSRIKFQRRPINAAVIGASLGILVALPLGVLGGLKIGRARHAQFEQGLPGRVEIAAYVACEKQFNRKYVNQAASWERAKKCNRIAGAARQALEKSKTKNSAIERNVSKR